MSQSYVCIGYGQGKKGTFSKFAKYVEYEKDGYDNAFVDFKTIVFADGLYNVGELKEVETNII